MDAHELVAQLEKEWDEEDGFFGLLRRGGFSAQGAARVLALLQSQSFEDVTRLDKRLVSLLWFLPTFMGWQLDRVERYSKARPQLEEAIAAVTTELMRLLGVP